MRCFLQFAFCLTLFVAWLQPGFARHAAARDVRLALVIGHEQGWKGEQRLPWVLSGDVKPMTAELQRIGYHVIKLENPAPQQARLALRRVAAYVQRYGVKTFLFYYSGHADKRFFHLGPKQPKPFSYREFLSFLLQLPVKRRFAILDACHGGQVVPLLEGSTNLKAAPKANIGGDRSRQANARIFQFLNRKLPKKQRFASSDELQLWYTLRLPKGVKRPKRAFDFARTPFLRREDGAGIQLIGTIGIAWHDPKMKASLLTAHLLRGLRGDADNVKDGRITIEELYNYVQARLYNKGQTLNRFSLFNGNYTLAPHYQSALHLSSGIRGAIKVSIGQFTWHYEKRDARRIAIPTIPGQGVVKINYQGRCWHQALSFPKGKSVEIIRYGTRAPCAKLLAQRKGAISIDAQVRPLPPKPSDHVLSLGVGFAQVGAAPLTTSHPSFAVGYRYRYIGLLVDYHLGQPPAGKSFAIHRLGVALQGGIPVDINELGGFFFGISARAGMTLAALEQETRIVPSLGLSGIASFRYFFLPRIGVRLGVDLGVDHTPTAGDSGFSFQWQLYAAVLFRL